MIKAPDCVCLRCSYCWLSRYQRPVVCPKCHSPYWNVERRLVA